jgi:hypothetical protein
MAAIDELIASYREIRDSMLADIKHWRENNWKLHHNHVDITSQWLRDQQRRADALTSIIKKHEGGRT